MQIIDHLFEEHHSASLRPVFWKHLASVKRFSEASQREHGASTSLYFAV